MRFHVIVDQLCQIALYVSAYVLDLLLFVDLLGVAAEKDPVSPAASGSPTACNRVGELVDELVSSIFSRDPLLSSVQSLVGLVLISEEGFERRELVPADTKGRLDVPSDILRAAEVLRDMLVPLSAVMSFLWRARRFFLGGE
jgi:hypothetical protein